MTPVIQASGLSRTYFARRGLFGASHAVRALDHADLDIPAGQTLGIVGESGSGKSTLGRIVLGVEKPDTGDVRFHGHPLEAIGSPAWRAQRARMQMIYQDPLAALDRRLPVLTQICEPLAIHGRGTSAEQLAAARQLLAQMGLTRAHEEKYPHELSGGQRQRVVMARALVTRPDFLVCDEPVSALDVSVQAQVINLLVDLQAELGLAMLFISHDLRVVRQISQRVAVMYLGAFVEEGDADELFRTPLHPYTRALVSAAPVVKKSARQQRIILQGEPPNPAQRPSGCSFHPRCPLVMARCRAEAPALLSQGPGRRVACHAVTGSSSTAEAA